MPDHLDACLLNLSHATLHRVLRQFGLAQGISVTALDLLAHLIQVRGSVRGNGVHGLQGFRNLLLHLRLLQLAQQLGALGGLLLQLHGVALHGLLGLRSLLQSLVVKALHVLHRLFCSNKLCGKSFSGVLVLHGLLLIALGTGLVSEI
ncbi:hypothetical protein COJE103337_04405 [Corynebacterium jeikeium]